MLDGSLDCLSANQRFLAVRSGRQPRQRIRGIPRKQRESRKQLDAGGGTRTPDTRIMIPLL